MAGGLLQLAAIGSQDEILIGNPQITFFKIVYRRYTNFSSEFKSLNFQGNSEISLTSNNTLQCKIARHADLLGEMYFSFDLPDIYSAGITREDIIKTQNKGKDPNYLPNNDMTKVYNFYWIKNIGTTIIKSVSISIGGQIIDKHYGEWLHIWNELTASDEKKKKYNKLIGNIPELYEPDLSNGNKKWYQLETASTNTFESSSVQINKSFFDIPNYPASDPSNFNHLKPQYPSIKGRRIRVPLQFWFCQNSGLALPLIALQYHDIYINIELRPVRELYTILSFVENDTNPLFSAQKLIGPNNLNWVRTAPDLSKINHYIGNFIPNIPSRITVSEDINEKNNIMDSDLDLVKTKVEVQQLISAAGLENSDSRNKYETSFKSQIITSLSTTTDPLNMNNIIINSIIGGVGVTIIEFSLLSNQNFSGRSAIILLNELKEIFDKPGGFIFNNVPVVFIKSNLINSDLTINRLWDLNPSIEANYIYLDTDERKKFALSTQEYLITQLQKRSSTGVVGKQLFNIDFNNPVRELIWIGKRDDINIRNDWSNYTNWIYNNIPLVGNNTHNPYYYGNVWQSNNNGVATIMNHPFNFFNMGNESDYAGVGYNNTGPYPFVTNDYDLNYEKEIFTEALIYINNSPRFPEKKGDFFQNIQPYQYHKGSSTCGINLFSFSLEPDKYQPSGSCNFSKINKAGLYANLLPPPMFKDITGNIDYSYSYDVDIFAVNYNILRIMGGMAGIGFSN